MRVIAGTAKGRTLRSPRTQDTRPITDRAKESLFSILAPRIPGSRFLDLFAGTGGVGIEALSRERHTPPSSSARPTRWPISGTTSARRTWRRTRT